MGARLEDAMHDYILHTPHELMGDNEALKWYEKYGRKNAGEEAQQDTEPDKPKQHGSKGRSR